jgi:hypothetical protein
MPVFGAVLAEGGQHDAVLQRKAPDFEGREEFGDGGVVGLGVGGCSAGRDLGGSEVGDLWDC